MLNPPRYRDTSNHLPEGISAHTTYTVNSELGAFEERGAPTVRDAEKRLGLLNFVEQAMSALGSPGAHGTAEFLARRGCLAHDSKRVALALDLMQGVNNEYGAMELARVGATSITPAELCDLKTPADYAKILPRLPHLSDSPYVHAVIRMACIVGEASEEWKTVELAERARAVAIDPTSDPRAAFNFALWNRLPTSAAPPCGQTIKALTLRDKFEPQMNDTI